MITKYDSNVAKLVCILRWAVTVMTGTFSYCEI
jgi:hypothetical protein